jgi:hypothetical protein
MVVAMLLVFLYGMFRSRMQRRAVSGLLMILVALNLMQFYQHARWIYPPYNITGEIFKASFFSFARQARVFIPAEGIAGMMNLSNDMEAGFDTPWMNQATRNDTVCYQGRWSSKADRRIPYSAGLEIRLDTLFTTQNRIIRVKAYVLSPKEITESTLVLDYQVDGKSVSYNQFILEEFVPAGKWTLVEAAWYVPVELPVNAKAKIYFFNPSPLYKIYIDNLETGFISMKDTPEFRKAEGVLLPEKLLD